VAYKSGCAGTQESIDKLRLLRRIYSEKDVPILLITDEARTLGTGFPILRDESHAILRSLGLKRSAQALIIQPSSWSIVYDGSTDRVPEGLEDLLNGRPLRVSQVQLPRGCEINYPKDGTVTYIHDVAPIIEKKCAICHRPGGTSPTNMSTYEEARGWSKTIAEVVRTKNMPPWYFDPSESACLRGDFSLAPKEIQALLSWIEAGAPRADGPDRLPSTPQKLTGDSPLFVRRLGPPSLTVHFKTIALRAGSPDRQFFETLNVKRLEEELWISAYRIRVSPKGAAHHVVFNTTNQLAGDLRERFESTGSFKLAGWSSDFKNEESIGYPSGTALLVPIGKELIANIHTAATETSEKIDIYLDIWKPSGEKQPVAVFNQFLEKHDFQIPKGDPDFELRYRVKIKKPIRATRFYTHMHLRGRSIKMIAHYPSGDESLFSEPHFVPRFSAASFCSPKALPVGTVLEVVAHYDNSSNNPTNPNPDEVVGSGPTMQHDEAMMVYLEYYMEDNGSDPSGVFEEID